MTFENFHINPKLVQNFLVLLSIFFLGWAVLEGYRDGRDIARSNLNDKNAFKTVEALELFFDDQSRFPTNKEFEEKSIMSRYAENFPAISFITKICPNSSSYNSFNQVNYVYSFCLERSTANFPQGKSELSK